MWGGHLAVITGLVRTVRAVQTWKVRREIKIALGRYFPNLRFPFADAENHLKGACCGRTVIYSNLLSDSDIDVSGQRFKSAVVIIAVQLEKS